MRLPGYDEAVYGMTFSPDGNVLATDGNFGHVRIWDLRAIKEQPQLPAKRSCISDIAFSPNGKILAGEGSGDVTLWNVVSGKKLVGFRAHATASMSHIVFLSNGSRLVTANASIDGLDRRGAGEGGILGIPRGVGGMGWRFCVDSGTG